MTRRFITFIFCVALALASLTGCTIDAVDVDNANEAAGDPASPAAEIEVCLGDDDGSFEYTVGYSVVDGQLGEVCFGSPENELVNAWNTLSDLVPPGQLRDLAVFTGFTQDPDSGDQTLAFVAAVDDTGSAFEMAVNLGETDNRDEFNLTMAHEFSHVFTGIPTELDRSIGEDDCTTYWNGEGCYAQDSIIADWVRTFWADKIGDFDPTAEETSNGADQRCDLDSGFLGPYAATSPEEDFAETFAAYVMRVPDETNGQAARLAWIDDQPGLSEFRDRAVDNGYPPQPHNFDQCG